MAIYKSLESLNSRIIGLWLIEEDYQTLFNKVKSFGFEITQVENFKNELKQKQWLAARYLIHSMDRRINKITYNEFGAPFANTGRYISLSHSKDLVAAVLDDEVDIGIDIQFVNPKIDLIKKKFCTKNELNYTSLDGNFEKLHIIWSAKEAIYKQVKIPGIIFKEEIEIEPFEINESGNLSAFVNKKEGIVKMSLKYEIIGDYTFVYTLNT